MNKNKIHKNIKKYFPKYEDIHLGCFLHRSKGVIFCIRLDRNIIISKKVKNVFVTGNFCHRTDGIEMISVDSAYDRNDENIWFKYVENVNVKSLYRYYVIDEDNNKIWFHDSNCPTSCKDGIINNIVERIEFNPENKYTIGIQIAAYKYTICINIVQNGKLIFEYYPRSIICHSLSGKTFDLINVCSTLWMTNLPIDLHKGQFYFKAYISQTSSEITFFSPDLPTIQNTLEDNPVTNNVLI